MPKRFYLATRKDRCDDGQKVLAALTDRGWQRTFTWSEVGPDEYPTIAAAELTGVREADALLVLLPGGYGTHVEIGAALALGIPVLIHAPDRKTLETPYPCVFHYHPAVRLQLSDVLDAEALVDTMEQMVEGKRMKTI